MKEANRTGSWEKSVAYGKRTESQKLQARSAIEPIASSVLAKRPISCYMHRFIGLLPEVSTTKPICTSYIGGNR
jgi:hypothetical protein